ncbi:bacillithiol biosynthesis deacetylase BshB1 [Fredinandcohnia quinoae]|uniref:Bacillithiol biosynthesis deacetylase BshB1 n=1 Tax=Fredinandcohnia quinoae TaxID=2918902 RepID=A0AAW5E6F8_9BACI|nr:bacillithiol biosynthesis deacetylase BshB1 [Fredinandcohnia sp. SECRCQ15]MCH1624723.1 bacillithiol biosynthesis deacetylase BshB1 [Fredinandcohnia sp. SECRCQ15]
MADSKLHILAFGAHADDVEIGMAGTIAKYAKEGKKIGICDLTEAELSSNGTVALRKSEAKRAADHLGVEVRENLAIPDRGIVINDENIKKVVTVIRKYKPTIIFAPYYEDRHPDHGNCAKLVKEAFFSAGIKNFQDEDGQEPHKAQSLYFYMINGFHRPNFVIDISAYMDDKIVSLQTYKSQFQKTDSTIDTPLVNGYIETIENRERLFGKEVGIMYAEGFIVEKPLLINKDLLGE